MLNVLIFSEDLGLKFEWSKTMLLVTLCSVLISSSIFSPHDLSRKMKLPTFSAIIVTLLLGETSNSHISYVKPKHAC